MEKPSAGVKEQQGLSCLINFNKINSPKDEEEILEGETFLNLAQDLVSSIIQRKESDNTRKSESFNTELKECLLNLPLLKAMENPITISNIVNHQATNLPLQRKIITNLDMFQHEELDKGYKVIHKQTKTFDLVLPGHCGQQQYDMVKVRFHAVNLQKVCITNAVN